MRHRTRRRKRRDLPDLTEPQILAWAEAHYARTGHWPNVNSGELYEDPNEKWRGLDMDLRRGFRGLNGGTSLARLLAEKHDVRNIKNLSDLSIEQILGWADNYQRKTGRWPLRGDGLIEGAPGETWAGIQTALIRGSRGLPGNLSLADLLAEHRGVRNHMDMPELTVEMILAWADDHQARTGCWPRDVSGTVHGVPGETWAAIDSALLRGGRGLRGKSSLPRLLAKYRGVRNQSNPPRLTVRKILAWADAFHERTGRWPKAKSGSIPEASEETWMRVATALNEGLRGLPGGDSLAMLLARHRQVRHRLKPPPLSISQIVAWAKEHRRSTGQWPHERTGPVAGAPGESWQAINNALIAGRRELPKGMTLARVLQKLKDAEL